MTQKISATIFQLQLHKQLIETKESGRLCNIIDFKNYISFYLILFIRLLNIKMYQKVLYVIFSPKEIFPRMLFTFR